MARPRINPAILMRLHRAHLRRRKRVRPSVPKPDGHHHRHNKRPKRT